MENLKDLKSRVLDAMDDFNNLDNEMQNLIAMLDLIATLESYATGNVRGNEKIIYSDIVRRLILHIKTSVENMRVMLESGENALTLTGE